MLNKYFTFFCNCSQVKESQVRRWSYLLSWAQAWFSASQFDINYPLLVIRLCRSLL